MGHHDEPAGLHTHVQTLEEPTRGTREGRRRDAACATNGLIGPPGLTSWRKTPGVVILTTSIIWTGRKGHYSL